MGRRTEAALPQIPTIQAILEKTHLRDMGPLCMTVCTYVGGEEILTTPFLIFYALALFLSADRENGISRNCFTNRSEKTLDPDNLWYKNNVVSRIRQPKSVSLSLNGGL